MGGPQSSSGTGFQDLAADSDFSPETPEIGPGPDSNVDTPMFDSAFGGGGDMPSGDSGGFGSGMDTPAPTQAMETPMFGGGQPPSGGAGGGSGFDAGGFGGGFDNAGGGGMGGGFDTGTPPPDFGPDTDMQAGGMPPTGGDGGGKKGAGAGVLAGVGIAALIVGILLGPILAGMLPLPAALNPQAAEISAKDQQIQSLNQQLSELRRVQNQGGPVDVSPEEVKRLQTEIVRLREEEGQLSSQVDTLNADVSERQRELDLITQDISEKNEDFLTAQEKFEELQNETAITQARQNGLVKEVERLTGFVGELEVANARRKATKDALEHNIDRLYIQVKESLPLTPEKYDHEDRLAKVESLRSQVAQQNWVTPELQQAYTNIYLEELAVSQASEYFFAKLAVADEYGNRSFKWAECLMQGNWGVLYRTLDGKNIGVYTDLSNGEGSVRWGYKEEMQKQAIREIEDRIVASRVDDWESKVAVLATKELAAQDGTSWQRSFESL
jgi:predicted  nucleic acid-binding Zn-ribbon protein